MKNIFASLATTIGLCLAPMGVFAAEAEIIRVTDRGEADKAGAPLRVTMPGNDTQGAVEDTGRPPAERDDRLPPADEPKDEPSPEDEDPPTFFGEPVGGNVVWVLDRSGSMNWSDSGSGPLEDWNGDVIAAPNRIAVLKTECIKALRKLTAKDSFAIITFGGEVPYSWGRGGRPIDIPMPHTLSPIISKSVWTWYDAMLPGTPENIFAGISDIARIRASGGTPAYTPLRKACELYGTKPNKIFFLCDGLPNEDDKAPNRDGGPEVILNTFPGWFAPLKAKSCKLVCVHMGNSAPSAKFMQDLANQSGGEFIKK